MASANGLGFGLFGKPIPVGFPSSEPQPFLFSCRGKWLAGPAMPSPNLHEVRAPGGGRWLGVGGGADERMETGEACIVRDYG